MASESFFSIEYGASGREKNDASDDKPRYEKEHQEQGRQCKVNETF